MNSFNKVIAPPATSMVSKFQKPLQICTSWSQIQDQEDINASILIPGNISSQKQVCYQVCNLQPTFANFRTYLYNNINLHQPSNKEYNLANLMNMQFDAIRRNDHIAAHRFQQLINNF